MTLEELLAKGIDKEVAEGIVADFNAEKTKHEQFKTTIFDEKKKWKTEAEEAANNAAAAAEKAKQAEYDAAKKAGDMEALESNWQSKLDDLEKGYKSKLAERDNTILGGRKDAIINDLAGKFINPDVGKLMLDNMVATSYGDDGKVIAELKGLDGSTLTNDFSKFGEAVEGVSQFADLIKGTDSTGGGAGGGGKESTGGASDYESKKLERRKKLGLA